MSPEMVTRSSSFLGPPVDCWALGVLLYVLLTGTFPFRAPKHNNYNNYNNYNNNHNYNNHNYNNNNNNNNNNNRRVG